VLPWTRVSKRAGVRAESLGHRQSSGGTVTPGVPAGLVERAQSSSPHARQCTGEGLFGMHRRCSAGPVGHLSEKRMKRRSVILFWTFAASTASAQMPKFDDILKGVDKLPKTPGTPGTPGTGSQPVATDDKTGAAGIKEALAVSTERAVQSLSQADGYFGNAAVKILMPSSIQKVADVARMAGYQKQVDEFTLSMNRAAEAAAPLASRYFGDAIRAMTLQDVRGILAGGDTAATDFFRGKTQDQLYAAFKPVVSKKVDEVGATRAYKDMMGRYEQVPLMKSQSLDLDDHVTRKALDGLFHVVAEEEKKIRKDPAARTTDLLKTVFGK
jgi:hypothetical protein